jgi:hypothetical protein
MLEQLSTARILVRLNLSTPEEKVAANPDPKIEEPKTKSRFVNILEQILGYFKDVCRY